MHAMPFAHADRIAARIETEIQNGRAADLVTYLENVVENLYQGLPSGDYGRGDVRAAILDTLSKNGITVHGERSQDEIDAMVDEAEVYDTETFRTSSRERTMRFYRWDETILGTVTETMFPRVSKPYAAHTPTGRSSRHVSEEDALRFLAKSVK